MLVLFILFLCIQNISCIISIQYINPSTCDNLLIDGFPHYFDTAELKCKKCNNDTQLFNGKDFSCKCPDKYYIDYFFGGNNLHCKLCPDGQVSSSDGYSCITSSSAIKCTAGQLALDYEINGKKFAERSCKSGLNQTIPNKKFDRMVPCSYTKMMFSLSQTTNINTPDDVCTRGTVKGGIYFFTNIPNDFDTNAYKAVSTGNAVISGTTSAYFLDQAGAVRSMCEPTTPKFKTNITACQAMANMCVLKFYVDTSALCASYKRLEDSVTTRGNFLSNTIPSIYFADTQPLTTEEITTQYQRGMTLGIQAGVYSLDGNFLGYQPLTDGLIQLCPSTRETKIAGFQFGTNFKQSCNIAISDLFDISKFPLKFYDFGLPYESSAGTQLELIPVIVWNRAQVNREVDKTKWLVNRRIFLVDNLSQRQTNLNNIPEFVTYAKKIEINVFRVAHNPDGRILAPQIKIEYASIDKPPTGLNSSVQVEFSINYMAEQDDKFHYDLSVAMGVMSALAACYAVLRTWSWSKRAGVTSIDIVSVVKCILFASAAIANVFLLVLFGLACYLLIFYKRQTYFAVYIPTRNQEYFFVIYLSVAFGLKCLEMLHLLASQCTMDIFFVDWEKQPGPTHGQLPVSVGQKPAGYRGASKGDEDDRTQTTNQTWDTASIWRTLMIANEWNEIQIYRRTRTIFSLGCVLLFLHVAGYERLAAADPLNLESGIYRSPYSRLLRFGLIIASYIVIAALQFFITTPIYEKLIEDKLANFVDLCSISNVSVFIMAQKQFGYYIHGQSVHGTAQVGHRNMHYQLAREKANVCAQRGLSVDTTDSDQQTFIMALPRNMRENWDRIFVPLKDIRGVNQSTEAYRILNRFLTTFISRGDVEHMWYSVRNRQFFENVFDCEFDDTTIRGYFYKDAGSSFGNVLFYGQEFSLITFEIALFCITDLIWTNLVLDACVVWLILQIYSMLRFNLSRRNLTRKTMIDSRFLI